MKKLVYVSAGELLGDTDAESAARWLQHVEALRDDGFEIWYAKGTAEDDEALARAWAVITARARIDGAFLDRAPGVKLICKTGVGMDKIDIPACTARGICVANTPTSNTVSVIEHTFALILALAKKLYPYQMHVHNDHPEWGCTARYRSVELRGKTIAVIGVGRIGTGVAKIANAFGMKVLGYDPYIDRRKRPRCIRWTSTMEEALAEADVVTVHVSALERNRGLIGKEEFQAMQRSALFVNTSRGFVVRQQALYEALRDRTIAGAALDVFETEPLPEYEPIMQMENFLCTPHCAACTPESAVNALRDCAAIVRDYARGIRPESAANEVGMPGSRTRLHN